jgi:hypothetical protein
MKVYIGPYKNWWGPYQIADLLQKVGVSEDRCDTIGEWLANTRLRNFCEWVESKRKRKIKVRIDQYDTWNMDSTLSIIITPMLRQLKEQKHGAPFVDDEDVPLELRSVAAPILSQEDINMGIPDDNHFKRWDWVLDEMIWAFEQDEMNTRYNINPEEPFYEKGFDSNEWKEYHKRKQNGYRLFGKYYTGLWT